MDRDTALSNLASSNPRIRLTAARYFARAATPEDLPTLSAALQSETVAWIRSALNQAIGRVGSPNLAQPVPEVRSTDEAEDARAAAVVEIASELLHELEPLVGMLRLRLITEWGDFEGSQSRHALDQIESFLSALHELNVVARVPTFEDFSLREAIEQVADEIPPEANVSITRSGPDISVRSNKALLQLIVRNGLRNAKEATTPGGDRPIVATWGAAADDGFFVAVIDNGPGPPPGAELHAFEIGTSTKRGHLGMGLAIAQRASESLGGTLSLRHGKSGGAVLRFSSTRASS